MENRKLLEAKRSSLKLQFLSQFYRLQLFIVALDEKISSCIIPDNFYDRKFYNN